jgi:hypothetical protein
MQLILSSRTLSILLNGTLGKVFHYRRDVRQSDPMSPLLFILTVDLLQSVINKECSQGHINLTIPLQHSQDFPILQYADDTLIIMEGCQSQLSWISLQLQLH